MKRVLFLLGLVALCFSVFVARPGKAAGVYCCAVKTSATAAPTAGPNVIKHVIVIVQENQTPDHLFNGITGLDTTLSYTTSTGSGGTLAAETNGIQDTADPGHQYLDHIEACNVGYYQITSGTGNIQSGDQFTVTINGHPVTWTAGSGVTFSQGVNQIAAAINADATDHAIVTAANQSSNGGSIGVIQPNNPASSYTVTFSTTSSTALFYVAPKVGGQCNNQGFDREGCNNGGCVNTSPFTYVPNSYTTKYVYAFQNDGTFARYTFQMQKGPSGPSHQFLLAGATNTTTASGVAISGNPGNGKYGCGNSGATRTMPIDALYPEVETASGVSPICNNVPTILDLLDANSLTYKYYEPAANPTDSTYALWDAPGAIQVPCNLTAGVCNTTTGQYSHVSAPETSICGSPNASTGICTTGDIAAGTLPAVSWVIPSKANSDHPAMNTNGGPAWVGNIINTVGASTKYWTTEPTAVVVIWDDWGGYYDHVLPPLNGNNSWVYGMRVPMFIVSPYSKVGTVDSTTRGTASVLRFIEAVFNLATPISSVSQEGTDTLGAMFNYTGAPNTFSAIPYP